MTPTKPIHEIRNPEIEAMLRVIGHRIGHDLPKGWGFLLFIYEFDPGNSLFYISDGNRQQLLKAMKEFIAKHEIAEEVS